MKSIVFTKMQGTGNDFVIIEGHKVTKSQSHKELAKKLCDRKFGIGADGVLLLEKSKKADARMRIINADGSEAEMCGNGARCAALYISHKVTKSQRHKEIVSLETGAGIIEAEVKADSVKIKLTDPTDVKLDISVPIGGKIFNVDFVNTGVPHAVIETDDLESVDVKKMGRALRHHKIFAPAGTNVNFIKIAAGGASQALWVRTYERGVEDETLACGTGSVASAIIAVLNHATHGESRKHHRVLIKTRSGEPLMVFFSVSKYNVSNVWLQGQAQIVFTGEYHV